MTARGTVGIAADFLRFAIRRGRDDGVSRMAGSLAYTSLLSLVPLFAIALAMLAAFPAFDTVRQDLVSWAFRTFAPSIGEVVQLQIHRFIDNAGRLSAIGILSLVITAIMLLVTIEGTMNAIFRVAKARSALSKLLVYWTALTLGPLLMGAALSLQGYVTALSRWSVTKVVTPFVALPLPTLLTTLAFAVMFAAIPNRRVAVRDALIGAATAALLFAALRWGFGLYITSSRTYASLYGAVAVLPVFLLWTYLSWLAILIGAEITAALPEWRSGQHLGGVSSRPARRLSLALELLSILHDFYRRGIVGASRRDLLAQTSCNERELIRLLARLQATGFTAPTSRRRVVLARDLETTTLADLVAALDLELGLEPSSANAPWRTKAETLINQATQQSRTELSVKLRDLVDFSDKA
ncbi:YihY family inner membrane protein [Magnetospirillum sulfuroxidans]|uniref:UPF0761 membrane protein KEC16_15410 n=1 Tax=Magnetospirillum sulfuroxidans TaxID=611300 RepID=A0ABS5IFD3_9PROT|nr:YihY family inner membrane protein [Magnetospirillum sulfuroxidans]MBR9973110.1 YihY family inner membrane protein [Magnetospirillum sulfuroxidans]